MSQDFVSRLERGHLAGISMPAVDRVLAALDADLVVFVRWRGGDLDRLLDRGHAALGNRLAGDLAAMGWVVEPEVTFSEFGERGSIDMLAWHPGTRVLLVIEVKTELNSVEETLRRHDIKARLAATIAGGRFGWRPAALVRLLVLPEATTARQRIARHAATFDRIYPLRGAALRRFLRDPQVGRVRGGILFLRLNDLLRTTRRLSSVKRVRPSGGSAHGSKPGHH